jgi:hypothetical protein
MGVGMATAGLLVVGGVVVSAVKESAQKSSVPYDDIVADLIADGVDPESAKAMVRRARDKG